MLLVTPFTIASLIEVDASSAIGTGLKIMCEQMNMDGMTFTVGTSCGAADAALKCGENGAKVYSLDGLFTSCDEFMAGSIFGAMVSSSN